MELCYNQETLLLILYFGILVRYFLHAGLFGFKCWWDFFFFFLIQHGGWWPSVLWFQRKWSRKEGFRFNRLVFFLKEKVLKSFLTTSWAAEVGRKYWERQASVLGLQWPTTDFFKMMLWLSRHRYKAELLKWRGRSLGIQSCSAG